MTEEFYSTSAPPEFSRPGQLTFAADGKEIAVITPDGKFQRGKDFDTDDAAAVAFVDVICTLFDCETKRARDEVMRLRDRVGELENALAKRSRAS